MPRASLPNKHEAVQSLQAAHSSLGAVLDADNVDLVNLGKALERLVAEARRVVEASGRTSIRLETAELALDLKTSKQLLEAFREAARGAEIDG